MKTKAIHKELFISYDGEKTEFWDAMSHYRKTLRGPTYSLCGGIRRNVLGIRIVFLLQLLQPSE